MNASIENSQPGPQFASSGSKSLWAAVGVLSVAVLGMGATMIYNQRSQPQVTTLASMSAPESVMASRFAASNRAADDLIEKPRAAPAHPAPTPARKIVRAAPKPAPAPYPTPSPVVTAAVCSVCGSVDSVTPVQRAVKAPVVGVGTVAGGVLGAVLGNQVGHGNGRAIATVLGAVGGGFAGNAIEGYVRKETVYQVSVRMEDGSRRSVEVARPPAVGSRVTVDGSELRTHDGAIYSPRPVATQVTAAQSPSFPDYRSP